MPNYVKKIFVWHFPILSIYEQTLKLNVVIDADGLADFESEVLNEEDREMIAIKSALVVKYGEEIVDFWKEYVNFSRPDEIVDPVDADALKTDVYFGSPIQVGYK